MKRNLFNPARTSLSLTAAGHALVKAEADRRGVRQSDIVDEACMADPRFAAFVKERGL
jgi:uncharacterized membrane protein YidH (DUF202 family)